MQRMSDTAPYASLTPDRILDALDSVGIEGDGRLLGLNSYENRVYLVYCEGEVPIVVKFYRPERWSDAQILEEHAFVAELAEREIPAIAPLALNARTLNHFADLRFAVYPKLGGRTPELDDPETLEWLGRFIGRIHAVGAVRPYAHRPSLDIASFGEEPRAAIPADVLASWQAVTEQALAMTAACYERAGDVRAIRLHGDCHPGNILWTEDGPHFVDLDDARMGPATQDLWMLLSGDRAAQSLQIRDVLAGYEQFMDFDRRELQLVEALRTLRLIHYAAWIARRWDDPAFPAAFPWFNTQRYWQDRILELREQISAMDEPPLA
jgi:Ser/Thr protein kinase RdoA (MazF antagonist)